MQKWETQINNIDTIKDGNITNIQANKSMFELWLIHWSMYLK